MQLENLGIHNESDFDAALASYGLATSPAIPTSPRHHHANTTTHASKMTTPHRDGAGSPVQKMYQLGERFTSIYQDLEQASIHRREVEENKLHLLREGVVKLEKSINSEIKRRQESDKSLQQMFDSRLQALESKVDAQFRELNQALMAGVEVLTRRVGLVEKEIAAEREQRPKEMETSTSELLSHLEVLQNAFEVDKIGRLESEALQAKRHEDEVRDLREALRNEIAMRDAAIQEVRRQAEKEMDEKARAEENFKRLVLEEIRNLKGSLAVETQIRESSEEQIVRAVGDIVIRVQDGLRLLSST